MGKHAKEALIAEFYQRRPVEEIHRLINKELQSGIEKRLKKQGLDYVSMETSNGHTTLTYKGNGIMAMVSLNLDIEKD